MAGQVGHEKAAGEGVAAGLEARAEVSVTWTRHLWRQTIAEAEAIGAGIAPLAIRDLTVAVFAGLDEIQSERGISESRLDCPLHGREGVLAALEGLRALVRGCYGVTDGLYVGLESVIAAVLNIRAASRTTHTIIGGEYDRRAVTHYRCELIGKTEAITAMQRWAAQMVEAFGEQPGYHALFEALERERTAKPG